MDTKQHESKTPGDYLNHGWTQMDTDSSGFIRVYPCASVVRLFWWRLCRAAVIRGCTVWFCAAALTLAVARAADGMPAFEQANRLYEEEKFTEAAAAYQSMIGNGRVSSALYFNLGNALFKSGQ